MSKIIAKEEIFKLTTSGKNIRSVVREETKPNEFEGKGKYMTSLYNGKYKLIHAYSDEPLSKQMLLQVLGNVMQLPPVIAKELSAMGLSINMGIVGDKESIDILNTDPFITKHIKVKGRKFEVRVSAMNKEDGQHNIAMFYEMTDTMLRYVEKHDFKTEIPDRKALRRTLKMYMTAQTVAVVVGSTILTLLIMGVMLGTLKLDQFLTETFSFYHYWILRGIGYYALFSTLFKMLEAFLKANKKI